MKGRKSRFRSRSVLSSARFLSGCRTRADQSASLLVFATVTAHQRKVVEFQYPRISGPKCRDIIRMRPGCSERKGRVSVHEAATGRVAGPAGDLNTMAHRTILATTGLPGNTWSRRQKPLVLCGHTE